MENQIREFTKRGNRRRLFKRVVSLLCVVVLLFTMNTLKRNANTLERIAMCGLQEHTHTAGCYNSSGELVCAIPEHVHTDACYQQSPSDDLVLNGDDLEIADGLVDAGDTQSLDLSLDLDQGDLLDFVQDSGAPASNVQDIGNDMPVLDGDLVFDTSYNNEETQQLAANTSVEEAQGAVVETQSEEAQQLLEEEQIAVEDGQDQPTGEGQEQITFGEDQEQPVEQPTEAAQEQPVEEETEQPVEEEQEQPVEEEQEQPVEEEIEQPVEEETEQPVEEETEQPAEEAQEQPVEEETEQPVEGEQLVEEDQDQIAIEEQPVVAEQEQPVEEVQEQLVIEEQEEPVVEAQEEPVIEEQEEPVVEEQEEPAVEEQEEPVVEEQEEPAVEEQEEPAVEEQEEPAIEEQEEPVVEEQEEPAVEEQEEPVVEEQEEPVVEEQEEPVVEEQEEPVVEEQEEPAVEEQEEPAIEEQEEPVVEEQEEPVVEEQEEPVVEEQEEPVVEEQEEPAVEEQEEPVVEEQEEPAVEEQEEPAIEEQEEPAIEAAEQPTEEEAGQPAEEEAEQPAEEEAEQPAEEEAEQPAEENAEQAAEEEAEQPAEEEAEQPAEEEAEQPTEEEAEQPAEEETEEPAIEEAEQPAEVESDPEAEGESEEEPEARIAYPAKQFQQGTAYINVSVDAPEGAFPEGTVMVVKDVEDQGTIDNIQQSVAEDFVEVTSVHAVDISFWYNDAEIEPLLPIAVVMSAVEAPAQANETVVVHVDDNGETQLVDSEATGAAEAALEMPAAADAEAQVFEADTFSVYALVTKQVIETKYIDDHGDTWRIKVDYGKDAKLPEGASLQVSEVTDETYLAQAEAALETGKRITKARFFDIKIMDGDREVQPDDQVKVTVTLEGDEGEIEATENQNDIGNPDVVAMHFVEQDDEIVSVETKSAVETDEGVVFHADGFSAWGVVYTVDFEYNGYQFSMPGGGVLLLSELFEQLHIDEDVADVEDVTFTDYSLLKVEYAESDVEIKVRKPVTEEITMDDVLTLENDSILSVAAEYDTRVIPAGEWIFTSLQPFDTYHRLTIVTKGGIVYEIDVTDAYNGSNNTVRLQDVVTDGSGDTTKAISVKLTEGGSISDMSRTASLKLRVSYVLTAANLQAMQAHAAVAGNDIPTIFYDFSSALTSSALADAIQTDTITLTDEGKNVGTVTIGANGVVTIQFTDKDWFAERTQLGGYFDLDLQVDTTEIKEGEDDHWLFPGAPEIGPIHYKDVLSNGGKAFSAQKLQDENGKDYYLIDYTASIYVNSDVTNVTFEDTLMTDGVAGGIQEVVYGSAKLDGVDVTQVPVSNLGWINGDPHNGFSMVIPSLTTGQHTVTYQVKIPAEVIEGMTEGERKDAVNKAEWKLTGDKTIPGGETHYVIEKPYRDVEVHKTAPETADPDGYVHYTITFGDSQTPLKNLVIMDSITDIQRLQGQIAIKVPGRADVNIDGSVNCTDANYSTGMTQLFWYKFGEDDTGYGPVTVEYTTKMINATTARQNGIFDAVNAINTAYEERTYKSDSTTTTVEFPHAPNITVEKTATVSPEDVDADGNWKPDATVQYTVTIGEAGEDLSYIRFSDQMSNLLTLTGDISVSVNGSTDSEVALAFKSALETSRNSATTGTLFDFTAPAGTTAPIVITYTTHLSSVAEAKAAQIYGDQHASNYISVGNEHDDEGSDVHYPNEYELTKSETHEEKEADGTQTIHWIVEYGDGVNNDMGGARIYDEMTKAQKLVAGSVKVTLSEALAEAITWPDGTVWAAGSAGSFDMPEATAKTATDGVVWTKFYSTDTNYSLSEMVPVFNLKLPDGFGTQKVTVAYDTVVISDREAMAANITGTQNVYNRATVGHSSDMETVKHDFPTITEHKPKVEKAFSRFDFENRLVYWTIAVSADIANGSGYPLTNVQVVEPTKNSSIQYHIDNVKVYNTDGTVVANNTVDVHTEDFDLSKISVVTESGVTLEPGVDYTIDYSNTSWIGNGAPTIHFPELNEKIYITIAYSTGNNDIINGFRGNNKINVFSDGGNDDATAETSYTSSDIDVTKIGQTDPKNRIIKWKVTINPQKLACALEDTIWFDDDIPSGHILVDYNAANSVFKTSGSFDASTATASPSINVYCSEYDNWMVKSLDATEYANQSIHANIIRSDPTNSSILWTLSKKTYEVEYYTWVDDTKWAEITSGLSGSEKVTNTATIHVGDVLIGEGTGSTTVSVEDVITKTDTTTVYDDGSGNSIVSTSTTTLEPTSTLTYKIDINPNREQLTEAGKKLSVTDTLNTKMELQTDSIKLYYYPVDNEGNEGARTLATTAVTGFEDLTISYNDDTRTMSIGGIPDMTHCELEYSTTARAVGEQQYSNTATLIGGGSHSHTITETHTVQYGSGGVTSRTTSLKLKKFDENNVTQAIEGAKFELYECTLAGGVLSDWTTTRANPDPAVDGDTTQITVLDTAKISAAISAGPGNANYEKLLQDFKIVSWTKSGDTKTTNANGLVTFQPVYEDKVYYWKETATAAEYDTAEIGVPHYFVLYPEKYANNTEGHTMGDVYSDEERALRRAEAKALDDACSLANGLTIACMVSDNGTTWNVNNIEKGYTSISATKEWQGDSDNFFKTRPTEGILLDLYKVYPDGTKELVADKSPMPLNADNEGNWPIVTWSKLPKTETLPSGQVVNLKYTVVERPVTNYTTEYSDGNEGVTSGQVTVTNTLIPVNTRISVKKVFDQGIANLPDQIIVKLWQICTDKNGVVTHRFYDDDILSTSNNWQYTWKALPTRDDKGNTFTYTVTEDVDALREDGFYFTAIYSDEGEGVSSADVDDPLIIRNIDNGLRIVKTLGGDGSLLTDAMKQQIRLTVEKVGGTSDEKVTFTLADMTVGEDGKLEKILSVSDYGWIDDGSLNVTEINPNFKHFGVKSVSYSINGGTTSVVTDDLGRVVMQNVTLQDGASSLLEITNEYEEEKTELPVQKLWQDVSGETIAWPADVESVTVDLMKVVDGEEVATGESLTLDSAHTTGLFANLQKYEFNTDRLIEYTVSESVKGYTTTVADGQINEADGKIITNKKDQPKLYVEKVWDGSSSFIPASIQVQLYESEDGTTWTEVSGGLKTITAADNWQAAFEDLTEGKFYKVAEVGSVSGWTLHSYSEENGSAFQDLETITITNKRTPPPPSDDYVNVGVQKAWTEDGKPVDAPVQSAQVKLVRYKTESPEGTTVHIWFADNGKPAADGNIQKTVTGETVIRLTNQNAGMPGWFADQKFSYDVYGTNDYDTAPTSNSIGTGDVAINGTITINADGSYSHIVVCINAASGQSPSDYYGNGGVVIDGHEPQIGGTVTWTGPVDVDYSAIDTSVGSEYDSTDLLLTLSAANSWQYEFKNLPKKGTESGTKYLYRYAVVEQTVPGFTTSYTYEGGERISLSGGTATALGDDGVAKVTNNRETTKITAKKKWSTNVWPQDVTQVGVKLTAMANGSDITSTLGITAAVNGNNAETVIAKPASGNEASITWSRLPKLDDSGNEIAYTIEETSVTVTEDSTPTTYSATSTPKLSDLFEVAVTQPNASGNATITNTPVVGKITVTKEAKVDDNPDTEAAGKKVWVGLFSDSAATTRLAKQEITITASGSGVAEFNDLKPGTYYVYELTGENGTAVTSGKVTVAGTVYTVSYENAGDTALAVSKTTREYQATVTNTRPGTGSLKLTKLVTLNGSEATTNLADGEYAFTVTGPDEADDVVAAVVIKVENGVATQYKVGSATSFTDLPAGDKFVVISDLDEGDYVITETEVSGMTTKVSGGKESLNNSTASTITVHVTAGENDPAAAATATFTNDKPYVEVDIPGTKVLENDVLTANQFFFTIAADSSNLSAPMPVTKTVSNAADGSFSFGPIAYALNDLGNENSKEFKYTISEQTGNESDIVYDNQAIKVTVTVTKGNDGKLSAVVDKNTDAVKFTNKRVTSLPVEKTWKKADGTADTVTNSTVREVAFTLHYQTKQVADASGNAVTGEPTPKTPVAYTGADVTNKTVTVTYNRDDTKSWKGAFEGLPKYLVTEQGKFEYIWTAKETKIVIENGTENGIILDTDEEIAEYYQATGNLTTTEGKVTVDNRKQPTEHTVKKTWNLNGVELPTVQNKKLNVTYVLHQSINTGSGYVETGFSNERTVAFTDLTVVDNGCTWDNLEKWGIATINGHTYTGEFKYWATETKVELEYTKDGQTVKADITDLFEASNTGDNATVAEGVQTITNTQKVKKAKVVKVWEKWDVSKNNYETVNTGVAVEFKLIQTYNGAPHVYGTITLDGTTDDRETTAWQYQWPNLPAYVVDGSNVYDATYSVEEVVSADAAFTQYSMTNAPDATDTQLTVFTAVNRYTGFEVEKHWVSPDGTNALKDGVSITLRLNREKYASNGERVVGSENEVDTVTFTYSESDKTVTRKHGTDGDVMVQATDPDAWKFSWDMLPVSVTENETTYTYKYVVKEDALDGYNTAYAVNGQTGAIPAIGGGEVVTNTKFSTVSLPATGGMGTGVIYGAGAALMLLAVLGLILLNRKRTDGEGIR